MYSINDIGLGRNPLTADEERSLGRFKAAYAASTVTRTDQRTGNRLVFARWLAAAGVLTDGTPERCERCDRVLLYTPNLTLALHDRGLTNNPLKCECGHLTVTSTPLGGAE